jgi:hypothetical protein
MYIYYMCDPITIARIAAGAVAVVAVYKLGQLAYVIGGLYPHMRYEG